MNRHLATLCALLALTLPCWGASQLTFNSSADPTSIVLNGVNRYASSSSDGFTLSTFNGKDYTDTTLGYASTVGNIVTVSQTSGSLPRFTFEIDAYAAYVSIHLINVEGAGSNRNIGVRLKLNANANLGIKTLDDVVESSSTSSSSPTFYWNYLWASGYNGTRGGVAIYDGTLDGSALDASLAELWANEPIPHPAVPSWTTNDVLNWVAQYRAAFTNMSEFTLEPASKAELYWLTTNVVFPNHIKRVLIQTAAWRGEYWPNYFSLDHVSTNAFPAGKADMVAYASFLHTNGVQLHLHNVSCGIGFNDPDYVVGHVDRRLAGWGGGTLEMAVSAATTRLYFRPATNTVIPMSEASHIGVDYWYVRIDDEIVQVGSFKQTEDPVWILDGCTRGNGGTLAAAHSAGTGMAGVYCGSGKNYIPGEDLDQTNSLMDELALEYATFINDVPLDFVHFDGWVIHFIHPWTFRMMSDQVYRHVDHPTMSSRVGGPLEANFEQSFSVIKDDQSIVNYNPLEVGVRLADTVNSQPLATSWLDTQYQAEADVLISARRVSLGNYENGVGISQNLVTNLGLFSRTVELFNGWRRLAPVLASADVAYLNSAATKVSGGHGYQSTDVQVLSTNASGQYIFTPYLVMGQTSGKDTPWVSNPVSGTGPTSRKQITTTGTTLSLSNNYAAQEMQLVIRVASSSLVNPVISINGGAGSLAVTGTISATEYLQYEGGTTAQRYDKNWKLLANLPVVKTSFNVNTGTNTVVVTPSSGAAGIETQFIVLGTPYVLATNGNLQ